MTWKYIMWLIHACWIYCNIWSCIAYCHNTRTFCFYSLLSFRPRLHEIYAWPGRSQTRMKIVKILLIFSMFVNMRPVQKSQIFYFIPLAHHFPSYNVLLWACIVAKPRAQPRPVRNVFVLHSLLGILPDLKIVCSVKQPGWLQTCLRNFSSLPIGAFQCLITPSINHDSLFISPTLVKLWACSLTGLNNVVLPTLFTLVNNIEQYCWAWIECNNIVQYCWQLWAMWAAQHCSVLVSSILQQPDCF
jgi:hypothetical protein